MRFISRDHSGDVRRAILVLTFGAGALALGLVGMGLLLSGTLPPGPRTALFPVMGAVGGLGAMLVAWGDLRETRTLLRERRLRRSRSVRRRRRGILH